jgi:hypothetical protein
MRMTFEYNEKAWFITGGFFPTSWGLGLLLSVDRSDINLELTVGPFDLFIKRYF